jgi:hypothetical protein
VDRTITPAAHRLLADGGATPAIPGGDPGLRVRRDGAAVAVVEDGAAVEDSVAVVAVAKFKDRSQAPREAAAIGGS